MFYTPRILRRGALVNVPIEWQLSIKGSEDVKTRLQEINQQFKNGEIDTASYGKGLREVNRDARALSNTANLQRNLFLASHPAINALSRATSIFASVSRAALAISNAFNLALLARQGLTQEEFELLRRRNEIMRELQTNLDPSRARALQEELNLINKRLKDLGAENFSKTITDILTIFGSVGIALGGINSIITKLIPMLGTGGLIGALTAVGSAFATIVAPILAAAAVIFMFLDFLKIEPFVTWFDQINELFQNTFGFQIPNVIDVGARAMADGFFQMLDFFYAFGESLTLGFTILWQKISELVLAGLDLVRGHLKKFADFFINLWNTMLNAIRGLGGFIKGGSPSASGFEGKSGSFVTNSLHSATGMEGLITAPTTIHAGEAGPEMVSITPLGSRRSGIASGGGNVVIHIHGSIITQREFLKIVDNYLKSEMGRRGNF